VRFSHRDSPGGRDDGATPADTNPTRCHQHALTNQTSSNITSITLGRDTFDSNDSDSTLTSWTSPTNHFASYIDPISTTAEATGSAPAAATGSAAASAPVNASISITNKTTTYPIFGYALFDNRANNSEAIFDPEGDRAHTPAKC
jgi:hypothetical protein